MKTKKNTNVALQLPGAMALVAAGATTQANAATVQITFNGSYYSTSGNYLDTDFGDDGDAELHIPNHSPNGVIVVSNANRYGFSARFASAAFGGGAPQGAAIVWGPGGFNPIGGLGVGAVRAIAGRAVTFSDASIRGGASTTAYLDVTASASSTSAMITFNRLIFDEDTGGTIAGLDVNTTYATYGAPPAGGGTSAVPEASTSLGLLALGAGGILTRRRQKRAA